MEINNINSRTELLNGIRMPVLGLGVYKLSEKEVIDSVGYALDAGYHLVDTAGFYQNESGVGEAVKNSGISREEIFVTTKVWNDDQGYQETLDAFEISRKKLSLEYIDLYLLHWPVPGKYIDSWKALEKLYKDGKVKSIGVCNCTQRQLQKLIDKSSIKPMVLQNEFHPRLVQQTLIDYCKRNRIQYEGWSPLMRGRILDNVVLKEIGNKFNKTAAQIVIRWSLQKGVIVIPKSAHRERIKENADVFDFQLNSDEMEIIDGLDRNERTGAHPDNFLEHFKK